MSNEKEKAGQAPAQEAEKAVMLPDMQITVRPIEPKGNLLGFASVKIGPIAIDDFKIVEGRDGLFVGAPSKPDKNSTTGYRNTVWIDKEAKEAFNEKVLGEYHLAVEQAQSRAANLRSSPEKESIPKQLEKAAEEAAKDNAARPAPEKKDKAKAER